MNIKDIISYQEFDLAYWQLGKNEQEWVRDEIENAGFNDYD